jgi:predicted  nucleic acid-binding Zn-ribbon protein
MKARTRKPSVAKVRLNGKNYTLIIRTSNGKPVSDQATREIEQVVNMWPQLNTRMGDLQREIDLNEASLKEVVEIQEELAGFNERLKADLQESEELRLSLRDKLSNRIDFIDKQCDLVEQLNGNLFGYKIYSYISGCIIAALLWKLLF